MKSEHPPYLPNPTQHLLMKAALMKEKKATQAWQAWKSTVDLDDIDYPSLRMLPMLYQNLKQHNVPDDPYLQRMKGIYRLAWVQNQLLFRRLSEINSLFQRYGIKFISLKGAALVFGYYHDYGVRPMHDLDLLVKPDQLDAVIRTLTGIGWRQQHQYPKALLKYRRELVFVNHAEQEIDVHWHLLREWCQPQQDAEVWVNTATSSMNGSPVTTLNPTFTLLHLCGHGYQWSDLPSFIWIADARKVITAAPDKVDWEKLLVAATGYDLTLALHNLLVYLSDELDTPIPSLVLEQFIQCSPSARDIAIHDTRAENPNTVSRVLRKHWLYYASVKQREGNRKNLFGFLYYFCLHFKDFWGLKRWWYVPFYSLKVIRQHYKNQI